MKTWTTKEGDVIKVHEMETLHIKNCISMLKRNMPDHEEDEYFSADFPESMDYMPSSYVEPGAKSYRKQIKVFEDEILKRI